MVKEGSPRLITAEHTSLPLNAAKARCAYRESSPEPVFVKSVGEKNHENPVSLLGSQWIDVRTEEGRGKVAVEASAHLESLPDSIEQVFILPPGITRNGPTYYDQFMKALTKNFSDEEREKMLVLAPQFLHEVDIQKHNLPSETLHWEYHGWKSGEPAKNPDAPISSYAVVDSLLLNVQKNLPNLTTVTLVGHSAGAQMLNRYAFAGKALTELEEKGIQTRAILANAGTLLYLSPERPIKDDEGDYYLKPIDPASVANQWPYGIQNPPPYVSESLHEVGFADAKYNFFRRAYFAIGSQDNDPEGTQVQNEEAAQAQGLTRFERVTNYAAYLNTMKKGPDEKRLFIVDGVAHSIGDIYSDPAIVSFLRAA